jgi:MtN3 and saliva related transmembrane protein
LEPNLATSQIVVEVIGAGAALCSTSSFVPQLIKLLKERTAEAVSAPMYIVTVTAFSLWIAYGLMLGSWPLVISNSLSLALSGAILLLKMRYQRKDEARDAAGSAQADRPTTARTPA